MKLGLDIGGTNSVFGVVDENGSVIADGTLKTTAYKTPEEFVADAKILVDKLAEEVGGKDKITGFGISAPNSNPYTGEIWPAPNVVWARHRKVPFVKMMQEATGIPCAITNDANAAALGEKMFGVAKNFKDFIMITLGTGLGTGVVVNHELVYGKNGMAGELGHTYRVEAANRTCACGRKGCLETIASATGVANTARIMLAQSREPSLLREIPAKNITSYDVSMAAEKGDKLAIEVYEFTGTVLGRACADFATVISPEAFVFFGGMSKAGELLLRPVRKAFDEHAFHLFKGQVEMLQSTVEGQFAAVIGASTIAP
ncbi:MAG: ROK family protein [Bacteroidaceae bacterium]|nr:ROK family protein [Bacteroidaceae bacterium]